MNYFKNVQQVDWNDIKACVLFYRAQKQNYKTTAPTSTYFSPHTQNANAN